MVFLDNRIKELVYIKRAELRAFQGKLKDLSPDRLSALKRRIKDRGFVAPLFLWKNNILDGHQRLKALDSLAEEGITLKDDLVPCVNIQAETEKEAASFVLYYSDVFGEITQEGFTEFKERFDLDVEDYKDFYFAEDNYSIEGEEVKEDDFDVPPEDEIETDIKEGDVIKLGNHRLMCGDSTKKENMDLLMEDAKADLIYTDPPYGMNAVTKSGVLSKNYRTDILNDDDNTVAIESFKMFNKLAPFNIWWGANYYCECLPSSECWIVWDKNNGESDQTDCELAWTNFRSVVRQFSQASEKANRVHPTQKPVSLFAWCVNKFSSKGEFNTILDLFGGSGSTLIACEQLNRICYMMELDPKYCEVICQRWEKLTGNKREVL